MLSFYTRHHIYRQGVTLSGKQQLRSQGPVPVYALCTKDGTRAKGRESANGDASETGAWTETKAAPETGTGREGVQEKRRGRGR